MHESTIEWLRGKGETLIVHINDERDQLARFGEGAADDLAELSHMVRELAERLHGVAAQAMDVSDRVRVGSYDGPPPVLVAPRHLRVVPPDEITTEVVP